MNKHNIQKNVSVRGTEKQKQYLTPIAIFTRNFLEFLATSGEVVLLSTHPAYGVVGPTAGKRGIGISIEVSGKRIGDLDYWPEEDITYSGTIPGKTQELSLRYIISRGHRVDGWDDIPFP